MGIRQKELVFCVMLCVLGSTAYGNTYKNQEESIVQVSLRMLGHKILLQAGDSTSTVAPITKEGDRYKIGLEAEFIFDSGQLVTTIDTVVKATRLANSYLVEVQKCESDEVVYSYLFGQQPDNSIVPCATRDQDKACYNVYFTIIEPWVADDLGSVGAEDKMSASGIGLIVMALLGIVIFGFYLKKTGEKRNENPDLITIGEYHFDKLNSELLRNDEKIELTSKESDLLMLLYNSANTTIEREDILRNVWGDEGDYVGRTLDVFISKLRKKLEIDANIKIVNIRGVGYKLILNNQR